jgi:hypothetical protein
MKRATAPWKLRWLVPLAAAAALLAGWATGRESAPERGAAPGGASPPAGAQGT